MTRVIRRDRRGAAAVEFAFAVPVLLVIYMGLAELTQGLTVQRRVNHVGAAVGDLVAQSDIITNANMADIFTAGSSMMAPYDTSTLKMRVTSITRQADGTAKADWSSIPTGQTGLTALTGTVPPCTATLTVGCLQPNLLSASGDNVILAEAQYNYTSLVQYVVKNGLSLKEEYFLKPRKSVTITRTS